MASTKRTEREAQPRLCVLLPPQCPGIHDGWSHHQPVPWGHSLGASGLRSRAKPGVNPWAREQQFEQPDAIILVYLFYKTNLPQQNPWSTPAGANPWPNAATDKIWEELRTQQEDTQRRINEASAAIEESLCQLLAPEKEKLEEQERLRAEMADAHPTRWKAAPPGYPTPNLQHA